MANAVTLVKVAGTATFTKNVVADDTIVIGNRTYTWVADPGGGSAYDVDLGADLETSLDNLTAAVNQTGTANTEYHEDTLGVTDIIATNTALVSTFTARFGGTWGNNVSLIEGTDSGSAYSITQVMASGTGDISGSSGWAQSEIDWNQLSAEVINDIKLALTEASDL